MKLGEVENLRVMGNEKGFPLLQNIKGEEILLDQKISLKKGEVFPAFIYDDHMLKASRKMPKIKLGEIRLLRVVAVTDFGVFLDWGLPKDLFLPIKEQLGSIKKDDFLLVTLYIDKSHRLAASMRIQDFLKTTHDLEENQDVTGIVYSHVPDIGYFIAVEEKYQGLLPQEEVQGILQIGETFQGRISHIKKDGRIDLSFRERAHLEINRDAQIILEVLDDYGGFVPTNDYADPNIIRDYYGISKSAFKRALGNLLKNREVEFYKDGIRRIK